MVQIRVTCLKPPGLPEIASATPDGTAAPLRHICKKIDAGVRYINS